MYNKKDKKNLLASSHSECGKNECRAHAEEEGNTAM